MAKALWIIRDEHRRYGAVLGLVRHLLNEPKTDESTLDVALLTLAFDYVAEFIATFHHPKEDRYLFRLLRTRSTAADAILQDLTAEHRRSDRMLTALRVHLQTLQRDRSPQHFARFKDEALAYIAFETEHALKESRDLLPIAEHVLTDADWAEIDAAFLDNDDPAFGAAPKKKFDRLLSEIANRAPAPYGYGPPAGTAITEARWPSPSLSNPSDRTAG